MPDPIIETQTNPIIEIQPQMQPVGTVQTAPVPAAIQPPIIIPSVRGSSIDAQIMQISEIAKVNPNVDVANLMLSVLDQQHVNQADAKRKHWAYLISVGIPGAGFICAIYYYFFSGKSDAKHIAWWCAGLTVFTIIITWITTAVIFSSLTKGTAQQFNVSNLEQQPAQLQQLLNQ
jgi:hypothetical protein